MEKPAVIFSEAGFKMFLDFIKAVPQADSSDNPVDKLVKEFYAREDTPQTFEEIEEAHSGRGMRNNGLFDAIVGLLSQAEEPMTAERLRTALAMNGFDMDAKTFNNRMNYSMKYDSRIQRVARGTYALVEGDTNA